MELAIRRTLNGNRLLIIALVVIELVVFAAILTVSQWDLFLLAIALGGALSIYLFSLYPQLLFLPIFATTSLDITGRLLNLGPMLSLTTFHLAFGAIAVFSMVNFFLRRRHLFPRVEVTWPLILFISIMSISLFYTPNFEVAAIDLIRMLFLALLLFLTVFLVENKWTLGLVLFSVIACAVATSGMGLYQVATQQHFLPSNLIRDLGARTFRAAATYYNPNLLGQSLMAGGLLALALLINLRMSWTKRIFLLLSTGVLFSGLAATFSRSSWLAAAVGVFLVFLWSRKLKYIVAFGVICAALLLISHRYVPFVEVVYTRVKSIFGLVTQFDSIAHTSGSARVFLVIGAFWIFLEHPLWGIGYRGFPVLFEKYSPQEFANWLEVTESHTLPATILAELGLIGFTFAAWAVWVVLREGVRAIREIQDDYLRAAEIGMVAVFVGFLICFLFSGDSHNNFFWILTGMIFAVKRMAEKDLSPTP